MKHLLRGALLMFGAAASAGTAVAASPFDGTWVTRSDTISTSGEPDHYLLVNGLFTCGMCYPGLTIKADGKRHPVAGHDYYDTAAVTVVDAFNVKMSTWLKGRPVDDRFLSVSPDRGTLTLAFQMYDVATKSSGKVAYQRVTPIPEGGHAISGAWKTLSKDMSSSPDLLSVTFADTLDGLKMVAPTGRSYAAKFDHRLYPMQDDPAKTQVSIQRRGDDVLIARYFRKNVLANELTYTIAPDGQSLSAVEEDKLRKSVVRYIAVHQQR